MGWLERLHEAELIPKKIPSKVLFDSMHWRKEIDTLAAEFAQHDPRSDCKEWVQENKPALWQELMTILANIDKVFAECDGNKIASLIATARLHYGNCIDLWKTERAHEQINLFDHHNN